MVHWHFKTYSKRNETRSGFNIVILMLRSASVLIRCLGVRLIWPSVSHSNSHQNLRRMVLESMGTGPTQRMISPQILQLVYTGELSPAHFAGKLVIELSPLHAQRLSGNPASLASHSVPCRTYDCTGEGSWTHYISLSNNWRDLLVCYEQYASGTDGDETCLML